MSQEHIISSSLKKYSYGIDSLHFVIDYIRENFTYLEIKSIQPYSFTIGSNHNGESVSFDFEQANSLFYGMLTLSINPNQNLLQEEEILVKYRSYWNKRPFWKYIRRQVENENLINEASTTTELFDQIELSQDSTKYDLYLTFVGFKIDII